MPTKPDNDGQLLRNLSITQRNAIDLLVAGKTDAEVADATGVTRQTVCGWRNHHPAFIAELNARRQEMWGFASDRLRSLMPTALSALEVALTDDPPDWRAAIKVLELTGLSQVAGRPTGPTDGKSVLDEMLRARSERTLLDLMVGSVTDADRHELLYELKTKLNSDHDGGPQ